MPDGDDRVCLPVNLAKLLHRHWKPSSMFRKKIFHGQTSSSHLHLPSRIEILLSLLLLKLARSDCRCAAEGTKATALSKFMLPATTAAAPVVYGRARA
mmetsp:Transcript_53825/g.114942  ORF Transcript_53825/g.114942 Transcript_53825/m.114942 type:complete len:98 (-) Transcript_53825:160-453(-)